MTSRRASVDEAINVLLTPGKGLIAPDEHPELLARAAGVDLADRQTKDRHRAMVLSTPGLETWVAAAVLDADAFTGGGSFAMPTELLPGTRFGSDTDRYRYADPSGDRADELRAELTTLRAAGVRFVKWRADVDPFTGSASAYLDTAHLAACAAATLECDLAPLLDVAMPNQRTHSLAVATAVTANALTSLHRALDEHGCDAGEVLVRMNMVRAGVWHEQRTSPLEVGRATLRVIAHHVPPTARGVLFMSTGLSGAEACADLTAINLEARETGWDRPIGFGFGRAVVTRGTQAWLRNGTAEAHGLIAADCAAASAAARGLHVTA
jgi:fructose-bisphosphate aldolase class 1